MRKVLEIDVGNSFCKWRVRSSASIAFEGRAALAELSGMFESIKCQKIDKIYICSVAGDAYDSRLKNGLAGIWHVKPEMFVVRAFCAGVKNSYANPSKMGADRWLASIAAANKFPARSLCIVDCGSAVNVEFISNKGEHIGGYIVPGLLMMQKALFKDTAQVKRADCGQSILPGVDTGANVANGCLVAVLALIERLQRKMVAEDGVLVLTGGDAKALMVHLDNQSVVYAKDLVLDGFGFLENEAQAW